MPSTAVLRLVGVRLLGTRASKPLQRADTPHSHIELIPSRGAPVAMGVACDDGEMAGFARDQLAWRGDGWR